MPPPRFSIRHLEQNLQPTGYIFIATTDVPCHLFMRWTLEKPRTHKDPVLRRGVYFPEAVRFCFVEYEDNEQEEAGDTLTHTFIKLDWPSCQTRYFYFWGTVAGEVSPSETPLFSKHFMVEKFLPLFTEPWTYQFIPPPELAHLFTEPWTYQFIPPPELAHLFTEPWGEPPPWTLAILEPWSHHGAGPPDFTQLHLEEWTS